MTSPTVNAFNSSVLEDCPVVDLASVNLTMYNFTDHDSANNRSPLETGLKISFYVLIIALALFGNTIVMATVLLNHSMRTTINCYLVNLAGADLLICFFCMWVHLVNHLSDPFYVLGKFMCKFNSFAQMTCLTSSVLTLTAISFDRLIAILFPFHVRITKQRTGSVILLIWLISCAVACPFIIYRELYSFQFNDVLQLSCEDNWPLIVEVDPNKGTCVYRRPYKQFYYALVTVTLFFLPVAIMGTAYILIIRTLWKTEAPGERNVLTDVVQSRARRKVIKMVVVVLLVFVVCWMPLQVLVLYSQFVLAVVQKPLPSWWPDVSFFANYLAYANSALNPLIYGGLNHNFRQSMCTLLKCACRRQSFTRPLGSQRSRSTISTAVHWSPNHGRAQLSNGRGMKMSTMTTDTRMNTSLSYPRDSL